MQEKYDKESIIKSKSKNLKIYSINTWEFEVIKSNTEFKLRLEAI